MKKEMMRFNLGRFNGKIESQQNVVYYRREGDEISLNITNNCPNACSFCIRDRNIGWGVSNLYLKKDPSLEDIKAKIKKAMDKAPNIKIKRFKICGYGEPILRIDILPELVSFIRKAAPDSVIQLTTTGWPLYHVKNGIQYFKKAAKSGLDQIYLGVHATNFKDYQRKVNPSIDSRIAFNLVKNFIALARSLDLKVICAFINLDDLDLNEIKNFVQGLGCDYDLRRFEK